MTSYRHKEGANFLMFDGHATHLPKTEAFKLRANGSVDGGARNRLWDPYRRS